MPDPRTPDHGPKPTLGARRTRILDALADGEIRVSRIAAWAALSERTVRADLRWLEREGFACHHKDHWKPTDRGRQYIAAIPEDERGWR